MRTTRDRIRHALSFEIIGIVLATPLGALVFDLKLHDIGVVVIASATIAMVWTYVYNLGFDHALQRLAGTTAKTLTMRLIHAVLFELGLMVLLLPGIAWYLGISLWEALVMDMAFALFYMGYAFAFNWGYDRLFPLPEWRDQAKG